MVFVTAALIALGVVWLTATTAFVLALIVVAHRKPPILTPEQLELFECESRYRAGCQRKPVTSGH